MTYPSAWWVYRRDLMTSQSPTRDAALSRFAARYRVASGFASIDIRGASADLVNGYQCGLKVMLAYSSLEGLERALPDLGKDTPIRESALATMLRTPPYRMFAETLQRGNPDANATERKYERHLTRQIDDLLNDPSKTKMRPAVERVRHLVAHGSFSPTAAGLVGAPRRQRFVLSLALATLAATDETFTDWVGKRSRGLRLKRS